MKKRLNLLAFGFIIALVLLPVNRGTAAEKSEKTTGSKMVPSALRFRYQVGREHTIRLTSEKLNKVWVEMPNKPPTLTGMNQTNSEIVLKTKVKAVDPCGVALVNVTFDKVKLSMKSDVRKKKRENEYSSDAQKTSSTPEWPNEPKLYGASYQIKIAPDTTVRKIIGLDKMYKKLRINKDDKRIVLGIISEEAIRRYHQQDAIRFSPAEVPDGKDKETALPKAYEKNVALPDPMIKAKALKKKFQVHEPQIKDGRRLVKVTSTVEPLHILPEGMEEPAPPNDFGRTMIKRMSDMNELKVTDEAVFNLTDRSLQSVKSLVDCTLIILEENIGMTPKNKERKGSGGAMFTQVKQITTFEVTK